MTSADKETFEKDGHHGWAFKLWPHKHEGKEGEIETYLGIR
jgi:hypothetical protein